jgi:hypothetical protein
VPEVQNEFFYALDFVSGIKEFVLYRGHLLKRFWFLTEDKESAIKGKNPRARVQQWYFFPRDIESKGEFYRFYFTFDAYQTMLMSKKMSIQISLK